MIKQTNIVLLHLEANRNISAVCKINHLSSISLFLIFHVSGLLTNNYSSTCTYVPFSRYSTYHCNANVLAEQKYHRTSLADIQTQADSYCLSSCLKLASISQWSHLIKKKKHFVDGPQASHSTQLDIQQTFATKQDITSILGYFKQLCMMQVVGEILVNQNLLRFTFLHVY